MSPVTTTAATHSRSMPHCVAFAAVPVDVDELAAALPDAVVLLVAVRSVEERHLDLVLVYPTRIVLESEDRIVFDLEV